MKRATGDRAERASEPNPARARERIRKRALNLVDFAPRTAEELVRRLAERPWAREHPEVIDEVVADFVARGLIGGPDHARALRDRLFAYAVDLLARAPRTERDLRRRLARPIWSNDEIVDDVMAALARYGYVDDDAYAKRYAETRAAAGRSGARRLRLELRAKGVTDRETIDRAVREAVERAPEADAVDALIAKRLKGKTSADANELRRLRDFLLRRGFDPSVVNDRIRAIDREVFDDSGES